MVEIGPVERERVEVKVQVERGAEALEEGDGPALCGPGGLRGQVAPRASANAGEERSDEGAQDIGGELGVVGAAVPERVGEGQDPLSDGNTGEDPVDEVGCGVGHGAALARGTNAAALA